MTPGVAGALVAGHRGASAASSVHAAAEALVTAASEALGASAAVLTVWDPTSDRVRCSAASGLPAATAASALRAASILPLAPDTAWLLVDTQSHRWGPGEGSETAEELLRCLGGTELLVLPLTDLGEPLGLLALGFGDGSDRTRADDEAQAEVASSLVAELTRALREERSRRRADYDAATELPGQAMFDARVASAVASTLDDEVGVLLVSVDQLQSVSRSFGRAVANELLRKVADRLLVAGGAAIGFVARLGWGGFGVLIRGGPGSSAAAAECIVAAFAEPFPLGRKSVRSTCRVGLATSAPHATSASQLYEQAETALHQAFMLPEGGWLAYGTEMTTAAHEYLVMETMLQAAVAQGELQVRYQPQVDVRTGRVTGAEALVRWIRPSGMISPDRFIPAAEASGIITQIDGWVLRTACQQTRDWLDAGLPAMRMGVNTSSRTLAQPGFAQLVLDTLNETGLAPGQLEVEITESLELLEGSAAVAQLSTLRDAGVHVAIDDFGTGYSNVGRLRSLPVDRVKIDQSFVREIFGDGGAICSAVIAMARTLDLDVIAEGVETADQLKFLGDRGCAEFQGYLKSPPVAASEFVQLLAS
jgi:predicted signal transduction protein with EAL and GGDEF domain